MIHNFKNKENLYYYILQIWCLFSFPRDFLLYYNQFLLDPSCLQEKSWWQFFFHLSCLEYSEVMEELFVEKALGEDKDGLGDENQGDPSAWWSWLRDCFKTWKKDILCVQPSYFQYLPCQLPHFTFSLK